MVRKTQVKPVSKPQTDVAFAQLLITAMRIYGDPVVSKGKAGLAKLVQRETESSLRTA
jgi:hypothetical protein